MAKTKSDSNDRRMFTGLREFLDIVDDIDELDRLSGAHWNQDMSAISDLVCKGPRQPKPALLFDDIPDYPPGFRTLYGITNSANRLALAVGMEPKYETHMEFIKDYREHSKEMLKGDLLDPEITSDDGAPFFDNRFHGDGVDVLSLPVPLHHEDDGGRYIGTADCVITRDARTEEYNVGTYRMQVFSDDELGVNIAPGHHGREHIESYHERGEKAPIVALFGMDPTLWIFSSLGLSHSNRYAEFSYAGALKGERIDVIEGPETGFPIPVNTEIVVEGFVPPGKTKIEGPFGETFGYYGSDPTDRPVMDVTGLYYRDDPILTCAVPSKPPYDYSLHKSLSRSANLWDQIEAAGVPGVTQVWRTEEGGARLYNIVAIDQQYAGHARQTGQIAAHTQAGGCANRWTVVVDDDIDVTDLKEVTWAISTRCDPETDIDILHDEWSEPVDPLVFNDDVPTNSRAIVDATIPYEKRDEFSEVVEFSDEKIDEIKQEWSHVITGQADDTGS